MRVTLRFSVSNEQNGTLRNKLATALESHGVALKTGETGTYECNALSEAGLRAALLAFWTEASNFQGPGHIDHVWMYAGQE